MNLPGIKRSPPSGFRLLRYFTLASLAAFVLIAVPLTYLGRAGDDFFMQVMREQSAFFSRVQDDFVRQQNESALRNLQAIHEADNINLTQLFANALWENTFAPLVAKAQRLPVEPCRAIADVTDSGGKMVQAGAKKACYAAIGKSIVAFPEFRTINARVFDTMKKSTVFKIKVYDLRGITVYSSEPAQIGEDKFDNAGFQHALAGKPASKLTHRDKFNAFEGVVENRDLIEIYVPATAPGGDKIVGVFEIYSDVTPFLKQIDITSVQIQNASAANQAQLAQAVAASEDQADNYVNLLLAVVLGLLVLLYGALFLIVRNGQRIIDREEQERRQAEAAHADSEARFRSLTEMSSDFYWESDAEHRLTQRNASKREAAESVFHNASPIGQRRWEIPYVSPDESGWQKHRATLDAHLPFRDFEISRLAADGSARHVSISGDPVFDASGKFKGYRGVGTDITEQKRREEDLRRFRAAMDATEDAIYLVERATLRFIDVNAAASAALGLTREQILELGPEGVLSMPREELEQIYDSVIAGGDAIQPLEVQRTRKNGRKVWVELRRHARQSRDGWTIVTVARDITERKLAEANLRVAATAFEAQEGMVVTDANNTILRVNRAFSEITDYSAAEAIGQTPRLLRSGRHDVVFYRAMWDSLGSCGTWKGEIWNRRKSGEVYPVWITITAVKDREGAITNYVATLTDITGRKAAEDEIRNLAFFDTLTQLPNRRLLMDRLHQALASSERSRRRAALLFIDLDHFKTLNDTLGHDKGDLLLQQVAQRLTACVREADTVARLGGDEFVVMLEELSENAEEAAAQGRAIAEKILATFSQPYLLAGHPYQSSGSIGIAPFRGHEQTATVLLKQADIAMYQAKAAGRNALRLFEPGMQAAIAAAAQTGETR